MSCTNIIGTVTSRINEIRHYALEDRDSGRFSRSASYASASSQYFPSDEQSEHTSPNCIHHYSSVSASSVTTNAPTPRKALLLLATAVEDRVHNTGQSTLKS
jgi:hypothetical protein